jgi:hypothetical protein
MENLITANIEAPVSALLDRHALSNQSFANRRKLPLLPPSHLPTIRNNFDVRNCPGHLSTKVAHFTDLTHLTGRSIFRPAAPPGQDLTDASDTFLSVLIDRICLTARAPQRRERAQLVGGLRADKPIAAARLAGRAGRTPGTASIEIKPDASDRARGHRRSREQKRSESSEHCFSMVYLK